jgi:hypothetical protein
MTITDHADRLVEDRLAEITARFKETLLTQEEVAELLRKKVGAFRQALSSNKTDPTYRALRGIARKIGGIKYYPAREVARILAGQLPAP